MCKIKRVFIKKDNSYKAIREKYKRGFILVISVSSYKEKKLDLNKLKSKYKHTIRGENIYIDIGVKND